MFSGMLKPDQKAVAIRYAVQPRDLQSWLHHLVYVRNLCAHHSRLWDRVWAIKPVLPPGKAWQPAYVASNERVLSTLLIVHHLLKRCLAIGSFATEWRDRVNRHLAIPPSAWNALWRMGMTNTWSANPGWQ